MAENGTGRVIHDDLIGAVGALLGVCDGAHDHDGQGFNRYDSEFARSLYNQRAQGWTAKQAQIVARMLVKYRGQLATLWPHALPSLEAVQARYGGLEPLLTIPPPATAARPCTGSVVARGGFWACRFTTDRAQPHLFWQVLEEFKDAVPNRRWDKPDWLASRGPTNAQGILKLAEKYQWVIERDVRADLLAASGLASRRAWLAGAELRLAFEFDRAVGDDLAGIATWDSKSGEWHGKLEGGWAAARARTILQRHKFAVTDELLAYIERLEAQADEVAALGLQMDADIEVPGLLLPLMPFQRADVAFALAVGNALVAEPMGLGKTPISIALAQAARREKILVVCPPGLTHNWRNEIRKFVGQSAEILTGTNPPRAWRPVARWTIVGDAVLAAWAETLAKTQWGLLVTDEAHRFRGKKGKKKKADEKPPRTAAEQRIREMFKGAGSYRAQAIRFIAKHADQRVCLTGTPVMNSADELWPIIQILGAEAQFGGYKSFHQRFTVRGAFGIDKKAVAVGVADGTLNSLLRSTVMVRHNRDDVLNLPDKLPPARVLLEIDNRAEYKKAEDDFFAWMAQHAKLEREFEKTLDGMGPEAKAQAIQNHRRDKAYRAAMFEALVKIGVLQRLAGKGKVRSVVDWTRDALTEGKLILFAKHIDVQEALVAAFPGCAAGLGRMSVTERQANVDRFQAGGADLFVASLDAMGVGWTGTAASMVAFCEFPWRPGDIDQATDRAYRIGQTQVVRPFYLEAEDTVDQHLLAVIERKRRGIDAAIDGKVVTTDEGMIEQVLAEFQRKAAA